MLRKLAQLSLSLAVWGIDQGRSALRLYPKKSLGIVLYYHAVPACFQGAFVQQLDLLTQLAQPWSLEDEPINSPRWVGLSFDDAYLSVWKYAVPELLRRNLPFTVFVPTGCLGQRPSWIHSSHHPFWHERVMSPQQLQELSRIPGVTLGSHTVSHPRLTQLSSTELERELRDSKLALEDLTGRHIKLLSFPHGDWNPQIVERAHALGYRRLLGIEPVCFNGDSLPTVIGRVSVAPADGRLEFWLKLNGCYRWAVRTQALMRKLKTSHK